MGTTLQDQPRWKVRVRFGEPRLLITGDQRHQEFSVIPGRDAKRMARMLRRAMRRLCPDKEGK